MKRRYSICAAQGTALLIFIVCTALTVSAQELPSPVPSETEVNLSEAVVANDAPSNIPVLPESAKQTQTTTPTYIFPTRRERFNRYVKNTVGPFSLLRTSISAGINQWRDNPEEWEQGASGYGKRFASGFGKNAIHHTVIYGLDSALGLDTGFKRSPSTGFGARVKHALLETLTSRNKSGKRVVSVPRLAGYYSSNVIAAETWYPERYSYQDGLRSGTRAVLNGFLLNLVREFVIRF